MRVALIGAGMMGRSIGQRLLEQGHALGVIAHKQRTGVDHLCGLGAQEYPSACALAQASEVIITCLPGVDALESVLFGENGVARASAGRLVIDCTTSLPSASRDFARRLEQQGHRFVEAPVTGEPASAIAGSLFAMVGGSAADIERAQPILEAFCAGFQVFGEIGSANTIKLISNGIGFGILSVVSEALATARKENVDMASLLAVIGRGGGQNRVLQALTPWLLEGDTTRLQVNVTTAYKDVAYYAQLAEALGSSGPVFDAVLDEYRRAVDEGLGAELLVAYPASVIARTYGTLPSP